MTRRPAASWFSSFYSGSQPEGNDQDVIRRLATKADCLFALHGYKNGGAVAVVESQKDEDEAADINAVQGGCQRGNGWRGG
jgi:hypothetical protein